MAAAVGVEKTLKSNTAVDVPCLCIDEVELVVGHAAVKARRRWSRGINCTSIVPAGIAGLPTAIVLVMARRARSQTLTLPRMSALPPWPS